MSAVRCGERVKFPTTRWSLLDVIRQGNAEKSREALGQLLTCYLPALQTHLVLGKGLTPDDAEDVVQEFVARKILEKGLFGQADRQMGKFRTFILTALDRFLVDWFRQQSAKKRSPGEGGVVSLDNGAEYLRSNRTSSDVFDVAWARDVLAETLRRMRRHCETLGRMDLWEVFECRVADPILKGVEPVDFHRLVVRFGFRSPAQASNVLTTAKRMCTRALRAVVAEYTRDAEQMESEIADLREILARSGR
jgi:RNA polymerase sigma-70 factor (ECF subfamily)